MRCVSARVHQFGVIAVGIVVLTSTYLAWGQFLPGAWIQNNPNLHPAGVCLTP
jgi:hypothetical protein